MPEFFLRLLALVKKEFRQMLRDRSNLAVGVTLPVIMIMLFGYGISFDLEHAALAIVDEGGIDELPQLAVPFDFVVHGAGCRCAALFEVFRHADPEAFCGGRADAAPGRSHRHPASARRF